MKTLVTNYTFDASAKTVQLSDYGGSFMLEGLLLITNITDNVIIYNFAAAGKGGTAVVDVVTLDFDTTSMDDTDLLQVFYDDAQIYYPQLPTSLGQTTMSASLPVVLASDQSTIDVDTGLVQGLTDTQLRASDVKITLDGETVPVTGTFWQATQPVSIATLPTLAAGTNNIGDVDVLTLPALVAGTALIGKVGIDQTTPGTTNKVSLGSDVIHIDDNAATISIDDGGGNISIDDGGNSITVDYGTTGSGNATGALRVELANNGTGVIATVGTITNAVTVNSHAVTNAGTFAVQVDGSALTSLQLIDDVVFVDDTATHATGTTKGMGIMAVANPTDSAVDANDIGMIAMTLARALKNDITTIAGTAPTTAGFIDIKGADGNIFIRQATASNLNMTEASAASIKTAVETIDNFISGSRGLVTEDNSAAIKTSVELIDDMIYTDDTSTHSTGTSKGALFMAAATPTDGSVNANDIGALAMTTDRKLHVAVMDALPAGAAAIGKLAANSGIDIGDVDVTTLGGQSPAFNTGVRSASTLRVTIATDDVVPASQSGTWTVQPGNTANTTAWKVDGSAVTQPVSIAATVNTASAPATSGGLTIYHLVSAASTNQTNVKASAGQLYGWYIYNSNASARKLAFHNTSGTPTAGASVAFSVVIPATSGANIEFSNGIAFSSGIGISTVTGLADSDATGVASNDLIINLFYK